MLAAAALRSCSDSKQIFIFTFQPSALPIDLATMVSVTADRSPLKLEIASNVLVAALAQSLTVEGQLMRTCRLVEQYVCITYVFNRHVLSRAAGLESCRRLVA
jgi:hypothetical protein